MTTNYRAENEIPPKNNSKCFVVYGAFLEIDAILHHVIGVFMPSEKHNQEKNPETFAHLVSFSN